MWKWSSHKQRGLIAALILAWAGGALAHLTLYHNLEVNLLDSETVRLYAIIHETDLGNLEPPGFLEATYHLNLAAWPPIREEVPIDNLPEGCRSYSGDFRNPGGELVINLDPASEKRLMLVIIRPGAFPQTRDMAPGDAFSVSLPVPPAPKGNPAMLAGAVALALSLMAALGIWQLRKRRLRSGAG